MAQINAQGIKHVLRDSTGRGLTEAWAWFLQTPLNMPFPFVDFALYPFPIINLSCK